MKGLACLILVLCVCSVGAIYNCKRAQAVCTGTCNSDGTCTSCPSGYEGYDCSVFIAGKSDAGCSPNPCTNGGTCYMPSGGSAVACLCAPEYTGNTCADKRYDLTCNAGDTMTIVVRPHVSTFSGTITVEGQGATASCVNSANPPTFTNQAYTACGGTTDTTVGSNTAHARIIILRFSTGVLSTSDERITFTCGTGDTVSKATAAGVGITYVTGDLGAVSEGVVPTDTDITFEVLNGATAPTAAVSLGTTLTVKTDLTTIGAGRFAAVRMESCTAASHQLTSATGYTSKKFVDNSCPDELKSFMTPMTKTSNAISFGFSAFKFDSSAEVWVTCIIKVCKVATDCNPLTCDGQPNTGYGRKKRQAGSEGETEEKVLWRKFNVDDPLLTAAKTLQEFKDTKACYQTWEMTATVIALAVALVIVLFICTIFIVKTIYNRRSRSSTYREDVSETASTAHFPHLPTIVSNKA